MVVPSFIFRVNAVSRTFASLTPPLRFACGPPAFVPRVARSSITAFTRKIKQLYLYGCQSGKDCVCKGGFDFDMFLDRTDKRIGFKIRHSRKRELFPGIFIQKFIQCHY